MWAECSENHALIKFFCAPFTEADCPLCRANELILDMFEAHCLGEEGYRHHGCQADEEAQRYLLDAGLIRAEECAVE